MKYEMFISALHYGVSVILFILVTGLALWIVTRFIGERDK